MEHDLSPADVAILIRARRIQKEKGIKTSSVSDICSTAGISRKTGYKWAAQHEKEQQDEQKALSKELATLHSTHEDLLQDHDDLNFQHEGLKLAWKIHRVDEMLASQKKRPNAARRTKNSGEFPTGATPPNISDCLVSTNEYIDSYGLEQEL